MKKTNKQLSELIELYDQLTPEEREEVSMLMLDKVDSREDEVYQLCKDNPKHLHALPVDKLREVASIASTEAHLFFVSALPNALDMLHALEGLTVFCVSDFENVLTVSELTDAITDIETIWRENNKGNGLDLVTWQAGLAGIPLEAVSKDKSRAALDKQDSSPLIHSKPAMIAPRARSKSTRESMPARKSKDKAKGKPA